MSTADEIKARADHAKVVIDAIYAAMQPEVEALHRYVVMHPSWVRVMAEFAGCPMGRHPRARGVRGRKRALHRGYRPAFHGPRIVISQEFIPWASVIS